MRGTSYSGIITPTTSSIFTFDIPPASAGQTCTLIYLLPRQAELQTSSFTISGSGAIDFSRLAVAASLQTSYANAPPVADDYGVTVVAPGGAYTIASFACPAGQAISFEMRSEGGTVLEYFQDYNPSP